MRCPLCNSKVHVCKRNGRSAIGTPWHRTKITCKGCGLSLRGTAPGAAEKLWSSQRQWQPADDGRLRCKIVIEGVPMHLDAIEVVKGEDFPQVAKVDDLDHTLDLLAEMTQTDGPWQDAVIGGKTYVIFAHPYER